MSRLFDASSIFKAVKENLVEALMGDYTLEIARYELGNVLWKENVLRGNISDEEVLVLARLVKDTLGLMRLLQVDCHEEQILDTARSLKITIYDAAYVYYAKQTVGFTQAQAPKATIPASFFHHEKRLMRREVFTVSSEFAQVPPGFPRISDSVLSGGFLFFPAVFYFLLRSGFSFSVNGFSAFHGSSNGCVATPTIKCYEMKRSIPVS